MGVCTEGVWFKIVGMEVRGPMQFDGHDFWCLRIMERKNNGTSTDDAASEHANPYKAILANENGSKSPYCLATSTLLWKK